jgi:tetratricopeptide (TPR) repeat protein
MNATITRISSVARSAVQAGDWATVGACAQEILARNDRNPEGHFLAGLVEKASGRPRRAADAFARALACDSRRYDAGIELAGQYLLLNRDGEALELIARYEAHLQNSPLYLDMAAGLYSRMGQYERAWPLYCKANALQPDVDLFKANLATCAVYVGKLGEARAIYRDLLARHPTHQRHHYDLSLLERAENAKHVEQMEAVLRSTKLPPERNIFLYYAIGKELEDLQRWDEAFSYYEKAGDAVMSTTDYDVADDIALIDAIIGICDADWLATGAARNSANPAGPTPIFIVGLPRSGTTLTERILSSHSRVETLGETRFMQTVLRRESGLVSAMPPIGMNPETIGAAARKPIGRIAAGYLDAVGHRLSGKPLFIDKLPENALYAGFIAKAYPNAAIVHMKRSPMDTCFAMYKQSFFRFAYTLENLARYYVAHDRLMRHWRRILGDRLIEVEYEELVADQERETRALLAALGLEFEPACLHFEENTAPCATASSVQVREKIHNRSIERWRHFEKHLEPLRRRLEDAGIAVG